MALLLLGSAVATENKSSKTEAKGKYPYALIGDDFGILNSDDFAIGSCIASAVPFPSELPSYPYWKCFQTKDAKLNCDAPEYDDSEKAFLVDMDVYVNSSDEDTQYITRRAVEWGNCKSFRKDWNRITSKEKYVCISGGYGGIQKTPSGKKLTYFVFDKFKTKKGCVDFFEGGCSLSHHRKNGCKE